jgi:2-dehydropantoate 2-reductase
MEIARFFSNHGISAGSTNDFKAVSWKKLVINSSINPVSAIYRIRNGELPKNHEAAMDMAALLVEGVSVAQKAGVPLNYGEMWSSVLETCRNTAENKSSMLRDIESSRPTEIEAINGSIIRLGKKFGVETPQNAAVFRKVIAAAENERIIKREET